MTTELKGEVVSGDFNPEQKRYLEGFMAGAQIAKARMSSVRHPRLPQPANRSVLMPLR